MSRKRVSRRNPFSVGYSKDLVSTLIGLIHQSTLIVGLIHQSTLIVGLIHELTLPLIRGVIASISLRLFRGKSL
jgi:hypothetical protein